MCLLEPLLFRVERSPGTAGRLIERGVAEVLSPSGEGKEDASWVL